MQLAMQSTITKHCLSLLVLCGTGAWIAAQEPNPTQTTPIIQDQTQTTVNPGAGEGEPLYKITVVGHDIPAINYFHREGATKIGFQGTSLLPAAHGDAKVEARLGRTVIDANFVHLVPANSFGPEYLTYVLWAITPEGRPMNLGEVLPTGSKDESHITVTTDLQAFGLVVTAEPYYAVTMPSDVVVAQNVVLEDKTTGDIRPINAHYTLLPRGAYEETAGRHSVLHPITRDERSPLELYEAENAIQIAEAGGAAQYAPDTLASAKTALQNAQGFDTDKHDRKETITYAREAVQAAEDARIITIRKIQAADQAAAVSARDQAQQQAQLAQQQADQAQQLAQQQAEARAEAEREAEKARQAQQQAELAQQQAQQAQQQASQSEMQMREQLRQQLNAVLETRETARGLIMNMSDVLFDFNKYTLKPEAREKLAKLSGILLAYPDLKLQVEGYTDNIGSDDYNQKLSEERADSVRDYLVTQNVTSNNVTAQGFGKSDPVADNSTDSGRAQNRRVELVVSGASIGIQQQPSPQGMNEAPAQPAPATPATAQAQIPGDRIGTSNPPQQ
jgi:outer membrane protein OmpA-like peptidoglycan-associated protein